MSELGDTFANSAIDLAWEEFEKAGEISNYAESIVTAASYYKDKSAQQAERIKELESFVLTSSFTMNKTRIHNKLSDRYR